MSFWMPLKKKVRKEEIFPGEEMEMFQGGFEIPLEAMWRLYTLAQDYSGSTPAKPLPSPGIHIGKSTEGKIPFPDRKNILLLPKLDFQNYPYLLFVVGNNLSISVEVSKEKGEIIYPFLSHFDRGKLCYTSFVNCGIFSSRNFTISPSCRRKRFSYRFVKNYP